MEELVFRQFVIAGATAPSDADAAVPVVGHDDDGCLSILAGEFQRGTAGAVERQHIRRHPDRVVGVSSPIDFAAFDHQEEAIFVLRELLDGLACHLFDGRLLVGIAVDVVGHLAVAEQCPHLAVCVGAHSFQVVFIDGIAIGLQIGFAFLGQERGATTDDNGQIVVCHLRGNPVIASAIVAVGRAVGRCRVRKFTGED